MVPQANTRYIIENVDWGLVLELSESKINAAVNARPKKAQDLRQQWYFESAGDEVYYITSASGSSRHITPGDPGKGLLGKLKPEATLWTVALDNATGTFALIDEATDSAAIQLSQGSELIPTELDNSDDKKWRIYEPSGGSTGTASAHSISGLYRVRTFATNQLLTLPSASDTNHLFVKPQEGETQNQQWLVTQLSSGKYEIKSNARPVYLGLNPGTIAERAFIQAVDQSFGWDLSCFTGINTAAPAGQGGTLSLGFPAYLAEPKAEVVLMRSDMGSPAQLWFFERWGKIEENSFHRFALLE